MGKILFWVVVIVGGLVLARVLARHHEASQQPKVKPTRPAKGLRNAPAAAPEAMVRCNHCGIHLPRSEALLSGGRTWCSQEHAKLGINK